MKIKINSKIQIKYRLIFKNENKENYSLTRYGILI